MACSSPRRDWNRTSSCVWAICSEKPSSTEATISSWRAGLNDMRVLRSRCSPRPPRPEFGDPGRARPVWHSRSLVYDRAHSRGRTAFTPEGIMPRLHHRISLAAIAAAFGALLPAAPDAAFAQKRGGTLVQITQAEPPTLASYISTSGPIGQVTAKIYDGLLEYGFDL